MLEETKKTKSSREDDISVEIATSSADDTLIDKQRNKKCKMYIDATSNYGTI